MTTDRMTSTRVTSARVAGSLYGLAAALIWGGFPVVTRFGVTGSGLDLYDVTFVRFAVAALLTVPVLVRAGWPDWRLTGLLTLGIGAPYILVVSGGLARAPVALFAVLTPTSMVLFSACLGIWILGERPGRWQLGGIAAIGVGSAVAASALIAGRSDQASALGLFVGGGALWALYTVTAKRSGLDAWVATAAVSAASLIVYGLPYLAVRGFAVLHHPWPGLAGQALYQGALVSVVALFCYSRAVLLLGAPVGACFAALVPALAMVEGIWLLGEMPAPLSALGLGLSTLGIAAVLLAPRG
ncbi:DMT family transporter [Methylobacterium nonmethylotrophicum]|uniref:DMT family transporter n=1 Tax=Methylobacterium nonmethylotrophicum TaxID=1141884 RepID=A0A4Z0NKA1_9HYPH|nr:DMT family transporter [Methylobacterium nonmethylotrophicum]TGD96062.1 DMT family transporter [Methylobacterium nonmethylotrophicum]